MSWTAALHSETTIEGEASILSRMLVLEVPPWEKHDPRGQALAKAEALREYLPSFTAHFIAWIAAQLQAGTLAKALANRFEGNAQGYQEKLAASLGCQAHTGRMIQNWAVLVTVYQTLSQFLEAMNEVETLPDWQDMIVQTVQGIQQERAGQVFLNLLGQVLASGRVVLARNMRDPEEPRPGVTIVGYQDANYLYLLPDIVLQEVNRGQSLRFNTSAIGSQLKEDGWLIPNGSDQHLTVQLRVRGHRTRLWRLKVGALGADTGDSGDN